jgi:6-phosphogluconate dehydrogenase
MRIGFVGCGRMGGAMAQRLMQAGHEIVAFDRDARALEAICSKGAARAETIEAVAAKLESPRVVWLMLPSGTATDDAVSSLASVMEREDVLIDGGNTFWKDDPPRAAMLAVRGVYFLDVGTSGGLQGAQQGYCLMVGGHPDTIRRLDPLWHALACEGGFVHAGPTGAGHFAKMVHNGIEYGLMQAYAEGFDILRNAANLHVDPEMRLKLDVAGIARAWKNGSVIRSWLLDLTAYALSSDRELSKYTGVVADSGEGRWALMAAIEERVPADVLAAALHARFRSQQDHTFAEKLLCALRESFGGHVENRDRDVVRK